MSFIGFYSRLVSVLENVVAKGAPTNTLAHRYIYLELRDCLECDDFPIINNVVTFIVMARDSEFSRKYRKEYNQ